MHTLDNTIVYFIKKFQRPLLRTEIVKLVYLFEYHIVQTFGVQYSNVKFTRDNYGPMASSIPVALNRLFSLNVINIETSNTKNGNKIYKHYINDSDDINNYDLPEKYKYIANNIIDKFKNMNLSNIIKFAYSTPPMERILSSEKGIKKIGRVIDMANNNANIHKFTKEQLIAARQRRDESPPRGTEEEYCKHLIEQYKNFEDLRRKANLCLKNQ